MGESSRVDFYQQPDDNRYGAETDTEEDFEPIRRLVDRFRVETVVEIGCGLHNFSDLGDCWIGVDVSSYALRQLRARRRVCADWAGRLPFKTGSIPFLVSVFVLEHVPDPESALQEVDRVVSAGGIAYLKPAFNVPVWRANGFEYTAERDLTWLQRLAKKSLALRRLPVWRFASDLLWTRIAGEARLMWANWTHQPVELRWRRLIPHQDGFVGPDSDAVCAIDKSDVAIWFASRGYEVLDGFGAETPLRRVLAKHSALVVRKRDSSDEGPGRSVTPR